MVADISNYAGREQAFVKHTFLESYLGSLVYKTAGAFDHIVYVDGFSGPWQSSGENYADTSFGIALSALRKAKQTWKDHGREVRMSAHLVEKSATAYADLEAIKAKFPDIDIHTYNADFVATAPAILAAIPTPAFAFFFIDPKGWQIDLRQIAPLLKRPQSEVVFNFMFDFINRFASMDEPKIVGQLNALIPHGGWQGKLKALDRDADDHSAARKAVLAEAFRQSLIAEGGYAYVAEIPVLQRVKDRTLYSLFYGTRHAKGIEVFRGCHVQVERKQAEVRSQTKRSHEEAKTGQLGLFGSDVQLKPDDTLGFLEAQKVAAKETLLSLVPAGPADVEYGTVWPKVLERHVVTRPDVNLIAAGLRKEGVLSFPGWEKGKRVPQNPYRMSKVA